MEDAKLQAAATVYGQAYAAHINNNAQVSYARTWAETAVLSFLKVINSIEKGN